MPAHPGELILKKRLALGLSRRELVALAGIGKTALYDVEHQKPSVQLDTIEKCFAVLGLRWEFHEDPNNPVPIVIESPALKGPLPPQEVRDDGHMPDHLL